MKHGSRIVALSFTALAVTLSGCLGPRLDTYQTRQTITIREENSHEIDQLWEAAKDVLREHRFRLDRVDRREGVTTTIPATSQHFFEFWRHDVDTTPDFWEATLNQMRRWVEVRFSRTEGDELVTIEVIVTKERFSALDRQFNNSGAAYQFFGYRLPATTGQERIGQEHEHWLDIGRDNAMEAYLLQNMLQRAATGSHNGPTAEP